MASAESDDQMMSDVPGSGQPAGATAKLPSRPWHEWEDRHLVAAGPDERCGAATELFRRHSESVTAVTRMILGSSQDCDDVVAEVFTALWRFPERFDPSRGPLISYLRVVARGRSIDLIRAQARRRMREAANESSGSTMAPPVEDQILTSEALHAVHRAVASLPTNERMVIEPAYLHSMSYREVAKHLDLPEGTVKTRIRRGLQRMRDEGGLKMWFDIGVEGPRDDGGPLATAARRSPGGRVGT